MFYHIQDSHGHWITHQNFSGKFGPFEGAFVKNRIFGRFDKKIDAEKYPGYKYAFGVLGDSLFTITPEWIENIS